MFLFYLYSRKSVRYGLFGLDIICLLLSNCIHFAVVMNFVSHCEMIIFYCKSIRTRLEEKSIHLLEAMKQILDLGQSLSQMNSVVSRMMSLLIVYYFERTILGKIFPIHYTFFLTFICYTKSWMHFQEV